MWLKGSGPSPTAPALGHSVTPLWLWGVIRAEPVGDVTMQDWQLAGGCRSPHSLYFCCLCHVSAQRQPMLSDRSLWAVSALILKSVPALPLLPVGTVSAAPALTCGILSGSFQAALAPCGLSWAISPLQADICICIYVHYIEIRVFCRVGRSFRAERFISPIKKPNLYPFVYICIHVLLLMKQLLMNFKNWSWSKYYFSLCLPWDVVGPSHSCGLTQLLLSASLLV